MGTEQPDFVHLHVHTEYSLLDGAIRLSALLGQAREFHMNSVAITDHGTMFGVVEFYEKALKANIKPIVGCECYIAPRSLRDKTPFDSKGVSHIVLLAENMEGYRNLCKLATIAQLDGFYYRPRIDKSVLKEHHRGLIALSACLHGEIPQLIKAGKISEAEAAARFYQEVFGENNFFLEVQHNGIDVQNQVNAALLDISGRLSIPMVATNDCHYLKKEDVRAHDVLLCIQTGKTVNETDRFRFSTDQLYFKSGQEMRATLGQYPGAIENTVKIADRCEVEFDFNTYHFPRFSKDETHTPDELFEQEVRKGYLNRLRKLREKKPSLDQKPYDERLEYEIEMIKRMGFTGYFLIVADFIRFGKENKVPVGPGRGSAAGSIVAYSLGITDLDPIEHGLIFERFLNPARISMPDIDVDFCINGREKVFKYVVERYGGGDYVAQIITYGKLKTRAVIRDVGRALDIPLSEVDAIAKMVPDTLNISLDEALEQEPKLRELAGSRPDIANLMQICRVLEGLPRHASTHAAGVVIGDKPLVEYLPLYRGKKGEVVTQLDMKRVEKIGLVKFDFLGLRNLTVIEDTLTLIRKQGKTPPVLAELDLGDQETYRLLSKGDTTGVFQLESSGMKELLVRLKPENFADVTALVALYRPGPLDSGMVSDYVECKHGRKPVVYLLPELEPILKETYGVILYQEQVMKIASELANYSMAEADGLRKAMGKKDPETMAKNRDKFLKGAIGKNLPEDKSSQIFDLMEKFGGYGFNKSHSAAYALIAYQTAFLKTHFPVEFMAALLTSEMQSSESVVKYISECRSHGIQVLPPSINESDKTFTVMGNEIRFGLVAVKNVGETAIDAIIEERKNGPFTDLFDFCERVDLRKVNKRVVESLIKCGAFDCTGQNRARMTAALEDALDYGQKLQREKADPQMGLFDMGGGAAIQLNKPSLPMVDEWDEKERLHLEKEALGFYISGHPLERYQPVLRKFANTDAVALNEVADKSVVRIGGIIRGIKRTRTKKGDLMAFVSLEDMNGAVEAVVFPKEYEAYADLLMEDKAVLLQGEVQKEENGSKLLVNMIVRVEDAAETWTGSVHVRIDLTRTDADRLKKLKEIICQQSGECSGFLHLEEPGKTETVIAFPETYRLCADQDMIAAINGLLGYDAVETRCSEAKPDGKNSNSIGYRKRKFH
ncbi:MAG: DNA polymerase III subunit alpha [Thermodesulfobacteriota bacterium]